MRRNDSPPPHRVRGHHRAARLERNQSTTTGKLMRTASAVRTAPSWAMVLLCAMGLGPSLSQAQQAPCDRACLTTFIDAYYAALVANNPAGLPQASGARITENAREKKLADTFWASADKVIWRFDAV